MSSKIIKDTKFFNRLDKIREYYNLNQSNFSKKLGIKPSYYTNLKKGISGPSIIIVINIAFHFKQVDLFWLLTGEGEMLKSSLSIVKDEGGLYDDPALKSLYQKLKLLPGKEQLLILNLFNAILEMRCGTKQQN
jgi:transcriptional regulator with XRE-family HTH domain